MKERFRGYYQPSDADFRKLWRSAHFSVDANVLLDVFRFSETTANDLMAALSAVDSRLWVSHQAAAEYHRNLPDVLQAGVKECQAVLKMLGDLESKLGLNAPQKKRAPPHVGSKSLKLFARAKAALTKETQKNADTLQSQLQEHPLKERVAELFNGKVGAPLSDGDFTELCKQGKLRYARAQPPGYCDAKKPEPECYGDLVVWRQMIDHCKETKVGLVFITDDQKEDWFLEAGGKTLGPRPELVEEFWKETGQPFYCYTVARFLELAHSYLKVDVSQGAIDEAAESAPSGQSGSGSFVLPDPDRDWRRDLAGSSGSFALPMHEGAFGQLHQPSQYVTQQEAVRSIMSQLDQLYRPAELAELAKMYERAKQVEQLTKPLADVEAMLKDATAPMRDMGPALKLGDELVRPLRELETSPILAAYRAAQAHAQRLTPSTPGTKVEAGEPSKKDALPKK